jgi:hypothetical protein
MMDITFQIIFLPQFVALEITASLGWRSVAVDQTVVKHPSSGEQEPMMRISEHFQSVRSILVVAHASTPPDSAEMMCAARCARSRRLCAVELEENGRGGL